MSAFQGLLAVATLTLSGVATAANVETPALENVQLTNRQIRDRVAIEALGIEYFYLLDHGQAEKLADLFTEDGVQDQSDGKPKVGRQAIRDYYAARSKTQITRHVSTNLRLVFTARDRVEGTRTFTRYAGEGPATPPAVPTVAEYQEVYVRGSDHRWRFALRKVTSLFGAAPANTTTSPSMR